MGYRNHEGYSDATAGLALERVSRQGRHRHRKVPKFRRLTFRLGNCPVFGRGQKLTG